MLKRFLFSVTCALFLLPTIQASAQQSQGETQYISDDLFTFLHSGPGRNYRILGSVVAGSEVTVLQTDSDSNYVEIVDDKDRTGWVDGEFVSPQKSLRELVPGLQQQLADATADFSQKLDAADQTEKMQWFTRGGIVALISLILGVIVAYLPKKRRKSDTWM